MPSPERGGPPDQPEPHPAPEAEPRPYYRASRFAGEQPAGVAYFAAQRAIYEGPPNDLSAYRFQLNQVYHVAVLGQTPPEELDQGLTEILARGDPTELPEEVLAALFARRAEAIKRGPPWQEGHYRPGRRLD